MPTLGHRPGGPRDRRADDDLQPGVVPDGADRGGARRAPAALPALRSTSNDLVASFAARAEAIGADAIAVTLDTTLLGWRTKATLDIASLPFLRGQGIAQYTSAPLPPDRRDHRQRGAPRAAARPEPGGDPHAHRDGPQPSRLVRLRHALGPGARRRAGLRAHLLAAVADLGRPRLPARAHEAPDRAQGDPPPGRRAPRGRGGDGRRPGLDHGGRQVDGSISTIEALPAIAEAVVTSSRAIVRLRRAHRAPTRQGPRAGRPGGAASGGRGAYGLGLAGEAGAAEVMTNLQADFDLTMGLAGCASIQEIGPESLRA